LIPSNHLDSMDAFLILDSRGLLPVWTDENRAKYNRDHLRYPSDLTDDEWAYVEPLIPPARRGGGKQRTDMRAVMNGEEAASGKAADNRSHGGPKNRLRARYRIPLVPRPRRRSQARRPRAR
jgi:hypothetical protein